MGKNRTEPEGKKLWELCEEQDCDHSGRCTSTSCGWQKEMRETQRSCLHPPERRKVYDHGYGDVCHVCKDCGVYQYRPPAAAVDRREWQLW